jgi:hypothetical protein
MRAFQRISSRETSTALIIVKGRPADCLELASSGRFASEIEAMDANASFRSCNMGMLRCNNRACALL